MIEVKSALTRRSGIHWFKIRQHHVRMTMIMVLADISGFLLASIALYIINLGLHLFILQAEDLRYLSIIPICLILYTLSKLYPSIGINPAEEIKIVFINTSIGFLIGIFIFGLVEMKWSPNYLAFMSFGLLSTPAVLCMRWGLRIISAQIGIWGMPVVVIGESEEVSKLANYFLDRRRLGFIPKYIVTRNIHAPIKTAAPLSIISFEDLPTWHQDKFSDEEIHTALVDISEFAVALDKNIIKQLSDLFPHLIIVSNMEWTEGAFLQVHDFEGLMGVDIQKNVLNPLEIFLKRCMDIGLSLLIGMLTLPIWLPMMFLIPLDSSGPILYVQNRLGKDRRKQDRPGNHKRKVLIYKFRTMVINADQILSDYLSKHPDAAQEWRQHQKLKNDPRITRVGKWLRKFSIDELPQLINVIKGDMSLVGPRPIMLEQIPNYGDKKIKGYHRFKPGLTGLWQVSGRNHTSFEERTAFDQYYIHNWSVWLDIYILLRTVWVVLSQDGAY